MTMPHLENCSHSSYGICEKCSAKYAQPDGWFPSCIPPSSMRPVMMKWDEENEYRGFFVYMEGAWYLSEGSKARKNQVRPKFWKEIQ